GIRGPLPLTLHRRRARLHRRRDHAALDAPPRRPRARDAAQQACGASGKEARQFAALILCLSPLAGEVASEAHRLPLSPPYNRLISIFFNRFVFSRSRLSALTSGTRSRSASARQKQS